MIACPKCGWELTPGARACRRCGAEVPVAGAPPVTGAERPVEPAADDPVRVQLQRFVASLYAVELPLGHGPSTAVYKGSEINPPRPVALKVLPPGLGTGPAAARFKDEARKAMALNHPNIVPIYRVGLRSGAPYFIAMKLVEGRGLDAILESQGALTFSASLVVLRIVTEALNYAHGRCAAHGHLNPANILVDRTGHIMVSDFGIARAIEDATAGDARVPAPRGGEGAAGDQFALGLVAVHMLGGMAPGSDPLASLRDVAVARSTLPQALLRVLETTLAPDPSRRYASTSDMLAAVKAVPIGDGDRREGAAVLGQLARGEAVPKLRVPTTTGREPRISGATTAQPAPAARHVPAPAPAAASGTPTVKTPAVKPAAAAPKPEPEPAPPAPRAAPPEPMPAPRVAPPVEAAPPPPPPPPPPPAPAEEPVELQSPTAWIEAEPVRPAPAAPPPAPAPPPKPRHTPAYSTAVPLPPEPTFEPLEVEPTIESTPREGEPLRRPAPAPEPRDEPAPAAEPERPLMRRSRAPSGFHAALAQAEPEHRSRTGLIAAAVVVLAALAAGGYFLLGRHPASAPLSQAPATSRTVTPPATPAAVPAAVPAAAESLRADTARRTAAKPAAAAADTSGKPAGVGELLLAVPDSQAEILLDGTPSGSGGFLDSQVTAGPRHVRISAPGYTTLDTTVLVRAGGTVDLSGIALQRSAPSGPPKGWLWLNVTPATATILVDGQRSGTGSLTQLEVTAGLRRVQISAPGYAAVDTMIPVNPGADVHIGQITLKSAPARP
jgi:eukaryotic-like serine/threonine-protein kinase